MIARFLLSPRGGFWLTANVRGATSYTSQVIGLDGKIRTVVESEKPSNQTPDSTTHPGGHFAPKPSTIGDIHDAIAPLGRAIGDMLLGLPPEPDLV